MGEGGEERATGGDRRAHCAALGFLIIGVFAPCPGNSQKPAEAHVFVLPREQGLFMGGGELKRADVGLARLAHVLEEQRDTHVPSVLVCAGDFVSREPYRSRPRNTDSLRTYLRGIRSELEWDLLASLGVDAIVPGRLERMLGAGRLLELQSKHPSVRIVSVNLADTTGTLLFPPSVVISRGGVRFGVVGINEPDQVNPAQWSSMSRKDSLAFSINERRRTRFLADGELSFRALRPPLATLAQTVMDLRKRCDVVVALMDVRQVFADSLLSDVRGIDIAVINWCQPEVANSLKSVQLIRPSSPDSLNDVLLICAASQTETLWKSSVRGPALETTRITVPWEAPQNVPFRERIAAWQNFLSLQEGIYSKWDRMTSKAGLFSQTPLAHLDTVETGNSGETLVRVRWADGTKGHLVWNGPLERSERPLCAELIEPDTVSLLGLTRKGKTQELALNSPSETEAMELLQFLALGQKYAAQSESLLAIIEKRQPRTNIQWSEWERKLKVLHDRLLQQRQDVFYEFPRYWQRRNLVYHEVGLDSQGNMTDIELRENNAWPSQADSIKRNLAGKDWRTLTKALTRPGRVLVATTVDRQESCLKGSLLSLRDRWRNGRPEGELLPLNAANWDGETLPPAVRSHLNGKRWLGWWETWKRADSLLSIDDFISTPTDSVFGLHSPSFRAPRSHVKFLRSGSSPWGLNVVDGRSGTWSVVNRKSRHVRWKWSDPEAAVLDGDWVNAHTFVLLGWSTVPHPRFADDTWGYLEVPTIWVGDSEHGIVRRFQGVLTPEINTPGVREAMNELHAKAFRGMR